MIFCVQLEKLGAQLATLSPLFGRYQRSDPLFAEGALQWLEEAEKAMSTLRLPEGAEMSALRGRILKAPDALPAGESRPTRAALRRARDSAAAEALERAESILRRRVLAAEERLKFFEEKLCEGVTAFLMQNELPPRGPAHQAWLLRVWESFRQFAATRPLAVYMAASLASTDRCYLLDQVLARVLETTAVPAPAG
jgi:hypothetical protein